jgi:hypothetical protein
MTQVSKACTGRWGFCAIYKHFSGFETYMIGKIISANVGGGGASLTQCTTWAKP